MRLTASIVLTAACACACHTLSAAEAHSMTGCLARGDADGSYVLSDVKDVGTVAIPQSSVDLAGHVGHKVEITGTTVDDAAGDGHAMHVTAMKHLAATCP